MPEKVKNVKSNFLKATALTSKPSLERLQCPAHSRCFSLGPPAAGHCCCPGGLGASPGLSLASG
jgi:hypothetical protein